MRCKSCQHDNRPDARHCGGCGVSLLLVCAACAHGNAAGNRFCDVCGTGLSGLLPAVTVAPALVTSSGADALNPSLRDTADRTATLARSYTPAHLAEKILSARSALEGERKQVTVLFCDMANSTARASRIGAESMHGLLNAFFELAAAEVHQVEGTINQFLGDGFMALFGAPVAHEDHVRRALLAALGIRQKLRDAEAAGHSALSAVQVRIGVNTGTVVVGKIGDNLRMDYTAVGDTTNLAARLQQLAEPGSIYVSDSVCAAGQAYFEFRALGKKAAKGLAEPVAVHDLTRARRRDEQGARGTMLSIGSPMVGRDPEAAMLQREVDSLLRGKGGIVVISGEPGAGKSRLVAETRRYAVDRPIRWLEGRAVSFGRSLSYWPFIEILKSCFAIGDDDGEDETWRKLEAGIQALFAQRSADMLPYLATVLKLRLPAQYADRVDHLDGLGLRRQVFLCMRQLFEQLALHRPVLLLLEDWHWADQSSIELAEHLLPLTVTEGLLAIFVIRPDLDGPAGPVRRFAAENREGRFHEIIISALSEDHSVALIGSLVGKLVLPRALRDQILRKTEGNPFFIEEVIRSLVADGYLVRDPGEGQWRLSRPVDQVDLPDTIQGLILARIDRLDAEVKQALKLASVIGRSFFLRVLVAISEASRDLSGALTALEQAELIRQCREQPEVEFIFKHALVQEAAYGSILVQRRRAIHRQVAEAIEALFADRLDEITSLLAYHYTCAEDWEKAQEYLFKAGDQAGRMAADSEALDHFRLAEAAYLKAFGDKLSPLQRTALARKIGAALYATGHYEQALAQFRRALSYVGLKYPATRGGVRRASLVYLGRHFFRGMRQRLGLPVARDMDSAIAKEVSTICYVMSWMDYLINRERMLLDILLQLHVGERSDYALAEARGLSSLGFVFMTLNRHGLARRYHQRANSVAQRADTLPAAAFAWHTLGFLDFYEGRWEEAEDLFSKAAVAYRDTGDIHGWGGAVVMQTFVVYFRGDFKRTAALTADMVRAGLDAADPQVACWGYQNLTYSMLVCGPLDEAEATLNEGLALARKIPSWQNMVYLLALRGKCHVLQGELDEAGSLLEEALQILKAENLSATFDQAEALTAVATLRLARVLRLEGPARIAAIQAAAEACRKAVTTARQMPAWLPEALRLQGTSDWLRGDLAAAQAHWRESLTVAKQSSFPIEHARTLAEMGQRTGDIDAISQAIAVFRQSGAKVLQAFSLHHRAQLLAGSSPDATAAKRGYDEALVALGEVRARFEFGVASEGHGRT